MNGHAVHNSMLLHGHTPRCGVMINAMMRTIPVVVVVINGQ